LIRRSSGTARTVSFVLRRYFITRIRRTAIGWLLLTPAAILLVLFTYWPTAATFITSIYRPGTAVRPAQFLGAENYLYLLRDPVFLTAARNNLLYAFGTVIPSIALAIAMAVWVNAKIPGRTLMRLAFFTPTILPLIAAANIWLFFYTPEIGLVNRTLALVGIEGRNWLGDPGTVLWAIVVLSVWKEAGFFMIFYLAGLQAIPRDLNEAAILEAAGPIAVFRYITFPLLTPTTLFVLINVVINAFKRVDQLIILTKGGPNNASNLILYYIYETAFSFFDTSYAGTLTIVLLVVLATLAYVKIRFLDSRVHYQ
jgi:sn-glycerol 3-phosphate transport system permease protein